LSAKKGLLMLSISAPHQEHDSNEARKKYKERNFYQGVHHPD